MNLNVCIKLDSGTYYPGNPGIELRLEHSGENRYRAIFTNKIAKNVKLDRFIFSGFVFKAPGKDLSVYRDGWTAVSALSSRRFGECDLRLDPDYMQYAVSEPAAYSWEKPNRFSSENVTVISNRKTNEAMLAGFITTAHFYNRFQIELDEDGAKMEAFVFGDGREVDPGETIVSEEFIVMTGNDGFKMLNDYAELWGKTMNARINAPLPVGWCSWYYYFSKITEDDVRENLDYLKTHHDEYPLKFIQIDDGYQRALGDWTESSTQFPHGIEYTIRRIREYGYEPGLWLAPFVAEADSDLYKKHPEFFLRNKTGEIAQDFKWRGNAAAVLDATRPDVQEWLTNLFKAVSSWGCHYVKLDFMMYESCVKDVVYYDKKATRCDAFRMGLQAIRNGMGENGFILGGTIICGPCVGLVDGSRYGTDITPYWRDPAQLGKEAPAVPNIMRNLICRRYMHRKIWINDPDVHIARRDNNRLTENEVLFWTDVVYMAGGSMLVSDRFSTLDPDRAALSKALLAEPDAFKDVRPEDLFEREVPAIWSGIRKKNGQSAIALFNPDDEPLTLKVELAKMHVPVKNEWQTMRGGEKITAKDGVILRTLAPHTSEILL